ncbi:hypothetical protein BD410DRAFT_830799 [Rickenella mellea]|uniref:DUF6533 domain-containing protein n=1 Tax=Rickenella mellea TaxID=50990 RepID=A0A4Y7PUD5_9AGAM|nr:hypothetical protein BD410DRAFT_830799 [Rickenella mellea]
MSDSSSDEISILNASILFNRAFVSSSAIVFYDYALTLPTEISEIWNSKASGARTLFFLTRYSFVINIVLTLIYNFRLNPSDMVCRVLYYAWVPWSIFPQFGLYCIFTLRTYAIYQKSMSILAILGLMSIAICAFGIYFNGVLVAPVVYPTGFGDVTGCNYNAGPIVDRFQLVSLILVLVFDVLVFGLTAAKTIRHTMEMRKMRLGNGLGYFILRDGIMYFLAKLLLGIVAIVIFTTPANTTWDIVLPAIGNALTIVLINRLVLNLRQVSHIQEANGPSLATIGSFQAEPEFATNSILGNLGAPLRVGEGEEENTEDVSIYD